MSYCNVVLKIRKKLLRYISNLMCLIGAVDTPPSPNEISLGLIDIIRDLSTSKCSGLEPMDKHKQRHIGPHGDVWITGHVNTKNAGVFLVVVLPGQLHKAATIERVVPKIVLSPILA